MVRALALRERRPLWIAFSLVFTVAAAVSVWAAIEARAEAIRGAGVDAELTAQSRLAPLLLPRDLMAPVVDERAVTLAAQIRSSITSVGPIDDVRIYSALGRILYASEPQFVGARPSYLRRVVVDVAAGQTQTLLRHDVLQTYVPIWLNPGGAVAVAELTQPFGPIEAAVSLWYVTALIAGGLMLACLAMIVVTTSAGVPKPAPKPLYRPAVPRRSERVTATRFDPGVRAIDEQRHDAERRAHAAEENFRSVQMQLRETLSEVKKLEGRLAMNETQNSTNDGELQALRDQLRETSERLHKLELDNGALRERMVLRQQELDDARQRIAAGGNEHAAEVRARLEEAEERVAEMAHEIEKLESELDYTNSKFHMTKLSEALREFDNDIEIQERDDPTVPPVIIRNGSGHAKTRAVG
jgi:peptidoglycan hydrolase CwlO-like protein